MVENSPPWSGYGFETTCKGEMGTFQDSIIYLESNINGNFTKIVGVTMPPTKDLEKCTNIAMVTFHNTYTSAWNDTILRCVVETDDEKLMDAEYVKVVPGMIQNIILALMFKYPLCNFIFNVKMHYNVLIYFNLKIMRSTTASRHKFVLQVLYFLSLVHADLLFCIFYCIL
jgi:hypothetical protein